MREPISGTKLALIIWLPVAVIAAVAGLVWLTVWMGDPRTDTSQLSAEINQQTADLKAREQAGQ